MLFQVFKLKYFKVQFHDFTGFPESEATFALGKFKHPIMSLPLMLGVLLQSPLSSSSSPARLSSSSPCFLSFYFSLHDCSQYGIHSQYTTNLLPPSLSDNQGCPVGLHELCDA